jgi:VWFA-related protein
MAEVSLFPTRLDRETSRSGPELSSTRKRQTKSSTLVNHCLIALIGLVITPFVSGAQGSPPSQNGSGDEYTLRLDANMVILSATVLDRHHTPVSGLDKGDFQIYEDGKLQQIKQFSHDDIPVTVGIVVDNSGSMGSKRDDVIGAAMAFARSSNPQDQMFVVNFNDRVSFGLPPGMPFTDRQKELQLALSKINTIGQTSLYDGIAAALDHLNQGARDKKVLVLISDGGDNVSKHSLSQVLGMAKQTTAIIYTIGIFDEQDGDQNPGVLRRLASETGGEAFFPESSKEVASICEGIARDIRSQYTLAYVPTIKAEDGSYRTIEVRASLHGRGRLSVRTRAGYAVPLAMPAGTTKRIVHDSPN